MKYVLAFTFIYNLSMRAHRSSSHGYKSSFATPSLFLTRNCLSYQSTTPTAASKILHWTKGSSQLLSPLHQDQNTSIMDSHGNRDEAANFFQRLHALRKTTKNIPKARNDGIDAWNPSKMTWNSTMLFIVLVHGSWDPDV